MLCAHACPPRSWATHAGNSQRTSLLDESPSRLQRLWSRATDEQGNTITFAWQAPPVADDAAIYCIGRINPPGGTPSPWRLFSFNARTGAVNWSAPISAPIADSLSAPAVDPRRGVVYTCTGTTVRAFRTSDGFALWSRTLSRAIINASPLLLDTPAGRGRLFITDYDGFGTAANLICINTDTPTPQEPTNPGDVLWSVPIGGASGATPAHVPLADPPGGLVCVATMGDGITGQVLAFSAAADAPHAPIWSVDNPTPEGFFGGVCIAHEQNGVALYAASYAFFGGMQSANLIKLNAATGELLWSTPSNRTRATPIALPGGRILLSTGIAGYGTVPSLQLFQDLGASAELIWDSAISTWSDSNVNGLIDNGEYTTLAGWSLQPAAEPTSGLALIGALSPTGAFGPASPLHLLDLARHPSDPLFVRSFDADAGGSIAFQNGRIYSIGTAGLTAFAPFGDADSTGERTVDDLYAHESAPSDLNADGTTDHHDRADLLRLLRRCEKSSLLEDRP